MPKVSVIIPTFNYGKYIEKAIDSVLSQTYKDFEIIVVDDGSTDNTKEIIETKYKDKVRYFYQENKGAPAARNRGIKESNGKYIGFLDADDFFLENKIEEQIKLVNEQKKITVICDGVATEINTGQKLYYFCRDPEDIDPVKFILFDILPTSSALHSKKSLLEIGGFNEDLPCCQERDLHLRLACNGYKFVRHPKVLFNKRITGRGIAQKFIKILDTRAQLFWNTYEFLKNENLLNENRELAISESFAYDARMYLIHGKYQRAKAHFKTAKKIHRKGGMLRFSKKYRFFNYLFGPISTKKIINSIDKIRSKRNQVT